MAQMVALKGGNKASHADVTLQARPNSFNVDQFAFMHDWA